MLCTTGSWKLPMGVGILSILLGSMLFFFPAFSLRLILFLFGFFAFLAAIILFIFAWNFSRAGGMFFILPLVLAIAAFLIGIVAVTDPALIGAFMAVIIAVLCIIGGLSMAFTAVFNEGYIPRRALMGIGGAVLALLGIAILFYTRFSVEAIVRMVGLFFLGAGIIFCLGGLVIRWKGRSCAVDPGRQIFP